VGTWKLTADTAPLSRARPKISVEKEAFVALFSQAMRAIHGAGAVKRWLSVEKDTELWCEETNSVRSSCLRLLQRSELEHPEVNMT